MKIPDGSEGKVRDADTTGPTTRRTSGVVPTFDCVILNVFIRQRRCHGQSVAPDTGSDVRDTEGQSASVLLVNESRHLAGFRIL